jgi:hypothetical protein
MTQPSYVEALESNLEQFLAGWGPTDWRSKIDQVPRQDRPAIAQMLVGLTGIEDDSFYMQKKLASSGITRLHSVAHFNTVWFAEEADHGRALAALAPRFGAPQSATLIDHGTFARDKRSIVALPALKVLSTYQRGLLAAYLVLGVLVEYTAITTYTALADMVDEPITRDILLQMTRQEGRHMRFYKRGASAVIEGSPLARKFAAYAAVNFWRPPGVDLFGFPRWLEIFAPLVTDPTTRERFSRLDPLCQEILGANITVMAPFLTKCDAALSERAEPLTATAVSVERPNDGHMLRESA